LIALFGATEQFVNGDPDFECVHSVKRAVLPTFQRNMLPPIIRADTVNINSSRGIYLIDE
jgi:hypothetical protein